MPGFFPIGTEDLNWGPLSFIADAFTCRAFSLICLLLIWKDLTGSAVIPSQNEGITPILLGSFYCILLLLETCLQRV